MSMLGRRHTPQAKAKMRLAKLGRRFTPEHKANISASCKRFYAAYRSKEPKPPPRPRSPGQIASLAKAQEARRRQLRRMTKAQRRAGVQACANFWAAYRQARLAEASGAQPVKPSRKSGKKVKGTDEMSTVT
jgi:hypothetical protein